MLLHPPAKINLFLAIRAKNPDGFHELDTIFARANALQDELRIEPADQFTFTCAELPGEDNLVLKAVRLLEQHTGRSFKYKIQLTKHIPIAAGLGGGSSDAASTLLALNELEQLGLTRQELMQLGAQVGMDVPFFLSGHEVARGTHYGERITPLPALPPQVALSIEPGPATLTQNAYAAWDAAALTSTKNPDALIAALHRQDAAAILKNLHNDFDRLAPQSAQATRVCPPGAVRIQAGSGGAHVVLSVDDTKPTGSQE